VIKSKCKKGYRKKRKKESRKKNKKEKGERKREWEKIIVKEKGKKECGVCRSLLISSQAAKF